MPLCQSSLSATTRPALLFIVTCWDLPSAMSGWKRGLVFLELGDAQLMLDQADLGRTFAVGGAPLETPFGRGVNFQIRVDAVTPILARLAEAGVALYLPLEDKWYRVDHIERGNRQFAVADPDGYLLRLFECLGDRPAT